MKILPCMAKAIVLLHEDGKTFEMAPFQVWRSSSSGGTVIRIGRNTLFFNEKGEFDGTESAVLATQAEADAFVEAFAVQGKNKGLAPETAYFPPGTAGYADETRAWPAETSEESGKTYLVPGRKLQ
jgi:hypothetical protein